ncbi:MAG: hypothetical protein CM15mP129_08880 [Chloroflexota bacterium]|nr:MAG: hypothetical protein CM15mP129_08880 [Chloroflexota bacterium]
MGSKTISNRILPKQIDDNYTGHILSQYVFIVFTLLLFAEVWLICFYLTVAANPSPQ